MSCITETEFSLDLIKPRIISLNFQEWHSDKQKFLSASFKFSKKDTSCNCTDTKQNFFFLRFHAQLHDVSSFKNLKEADKNFCLSECHYWKFREIILGFIKPKETTVFVIDETEGLKQLTRLRLNFSHSNEQKFRHDLGDTVDTICKRGLETEKTLHFSLCCWLYSTIRTELLKDISTVDSSLTNYPDDNLSNIFFYGSEYCSV